VLAAPHRRSDGAPASPLRYSAPRVFDTAFPARLSPTRPARGVAREGSDGARWELRARRRRSARTPRSSARWPFRRFMLRGWRRCTGNGISCARPSTCGGCAASRSRAA